MLKTKKVEKSVNVVVVAEDAVLLTVLQAHTQKVAGKLRWKTNFCKCKKKLFGSKENVFFSKKKWDESIKKITKNQH